jgi:glycosyltransferase involved in cell wall biosynthesis
MDKRRRILSIIGGLGFGGAEQRLLSFARNLDRERFEQTVLILNGVAAAGRDPGAPAMLTSFEQAGVRVLQAPVVKKGKPGRFIRRIRTVCKLISGLRIDLLDAHCESAALLSSIAGTVMRVPHVATLYHPEPLYPPRFWSIAKQIMLTNIDLVVTDSLVRGLEIQKAARFKRLPLAVIPNGPPPPQPEQTADVIRRALGLPFDSRIRVVAQISTLREFKGQMVLLEAARSVLETFPDAFFLLIGYEKGSPGLKDRLERKALELGISDRVRITGYPGPIGDVWNIVDVHVHPTLFDSLPNAIIEGMSLGKPAVVTAVGGIPEAVIHNETGLVVPPGDAPKLAEAIRRLLANPALAEEFGSAALRRYEERYQPELMARKIESCFTEVINGCSIRHSSVIGYADVRSW